MLHSIVSFIKRKILRDPKERWNHQFAQGRWDDLRDSNELQRIEATAKLVAKHKKNAAPSILEIGAGEGFFRKFFEKDDFSFFLGTDIADVAIERANEWFGDEKTAFEVRDMDNWQPAQQFDFIIFNECVYHSRDQVRMMANFAKHLTPNGVFIVSVHRNFKPYRELWQKVIGNANIIDEVTVENEKSIWDIRVFR
jgi:2-polyprenyl-3-methyl-5-hydroxy-6-metoxy-1,4-benzoquinol methylase